MLLHGSLDLLMMRILAPLVRVDDSVAEVTQNYATFRTLSHETHQILNLLHIYGHTMIPTNLYRLLLAQRIRPRIWT